MSNDKKTENHYHITKSDLDSANNKTDSVGGCCLIIVGILLLATLWSIEGKLSEILLELTK